MPLHLLDNLANLTDPASSRNALALGTGDSPQFASIITSGATISGSLNATDSVDFSGGVTFQTSFSDYIDLNAPTITSNATTINLNATNIALNATNAITVGAPINSSITLNGSLTASGIVTSPDFSLTGTTGGEFVASKSILGWTFGSKASIPLTIDSTPTGVDFKPDGTVMFVLGSTNRRVYAYNLSPAWDVSTASATPSLSTIQLDAVPEGVRFSPDGQYMFVVSSSTDVVRRYTMSAGNEWNISTITTADQTFGLPVGVPRGLCFKPDGTKMYVFDDNSNLILEYTLSPAWTITGATLANSVLIIDSTREIDISSDGKRIFVIVDGGAGFDIIYEYTLPTAWNVSGAFYTGRMFRPVDFTAFPAGGPVAPESGPSGIYYNDVLNKCFFVGSTTDRVQEIIVTPQPAIIGTRPIIQSNPLNSNVDRVTMNSLFVYDGTNTNSSSSGALIVAGGIAAGGNMVCGGGSAAFSYQVGNGGVFWSSSTLISAPSNGVLRISTNAGNDFFRLQFGGIDGNFPAIKRNGTGLDIVLASDAGFTNLKAKQITATGPIIFQNTTVAGAAAYSGSAFIGAMLYINDEEGGPTMAFYDGTNWLRVQDRAIIVTPP